MSKIRVVHYINNFFAGIGGEEKADIPPEKRAGVVGPGIAFQSQFNDDAEIISTVICGDTYFGENIESATQELLKMIKKKILIYLLQVQHLMQVDMGSLWDYL